MRPSWVVHLDASLTTIDPGFPVATSSHIMIKKVCCKSLSPVSARAVMDAATGEIAPRFCGFPSSPSLSSPSSSNAVGTRSLCMYLAIIRCFGGHYWERFNIIISESPFAHIDP